MVIKKWNPTGGVNNNGAWEAVYPKVTTAELYTSDGATSIFNGNKIKIDYLPDAVFDSLYFQATLSGALSTAGAYADYWEPGIEHAITNRKSASAFKGYYYQISSAGTIAAQGTAASGGVRGTNAQDKYFSWAFNNQDGGTGAGGSSSGYLEAGDWIVVENVSGGGTSATDPYFIEFSVVNNVYELMTGTTRTGTGTQLDPYIYTAGSRGLVPDPGTGDYDKFLKGDGTWAIPTDTNTFRTVTIGGTSIGTSNDLDISAGTNVSFTGTAADGDITINSTNTTYSVSAEDHATDTTQKLIRLTDSDSVNDDISITAGSNMSISRNGDQIILAADAYTAGDGIGVTNKEFSVAGGVGLTQQTLGLKMTHPIAVRNSAPDAAFQIQATTTAGALWFDLS